MKITTNYCERKDIFSIEKPQQFTNSHVTARIRQEHTPLSLQYSILLI